MEHTEKGTGQALSPNDLHPFGLAFSWQQTYSIRVRRVAVTLGGSTFFTSDVLGCHVGSLKSAPVGVFIPRKLADDTNQISAPPSLPVKSQL